MIPKIIHYCWFGRSEKPELAKKCIDSWIRYCPAYKIIEWNEDNCDFSTAPAFVHKALKAQNWAFVSDYVRLKVVYEYGGVYLDTDVELIRPLDPLLNNKIYFGVQEDLHPATGLGFGSEKGIPFLKELMSTYESSHISSQDSLDMIPCPDRDLEVFLVHGFIMDGREQTLDGYIHIYPTDYFCPVSFDLYKKNFTPNTISIHWYAASWHPVYGKKGRLYRIIRKKMCIAADYILHIPNRIGMKVLGMERYEHLKTVIKNKR